VVDPRRSATAAVADLHLQPVPGTDLSVALGLLRLAGEQRWLDHGYLAARTRGAEAALAAAAAWPAERVESESGITPAQLDQLLVALARPPSAMLLTGRGPEQQSKGTDTVSALINLMLVLGRVGRPHSGYGCLTGQANGQGGREHGQKSDQLPGYRSITEPDDVAAVAAVWGLDPGQIPGPGLSAMEMIDSIGEPGGLRALVVAGSDPAVASPDAGSVRARLGRLDTLAVLDSFLSDTARAADIVLPVTQWAEEDGTLTSLEGRVLRRRRALDPPAGVRSDIEVLCALASRLGQGERFGYGGAEAIFEELGRASAGARADYSGITYERLDAGEALHWPCPGPGHPGTPRLFADRFAHPDGRARLVAVEYRPAAEEPDADYPVRFTTGRYREHYNSGNQTRRLGSLHDRRPEPVLQVHPSLARHRGLTDGEMASVESRRGVVRFRVELSEDIRPDTVFAPFHWAGGQAANLLTSAALDPISRMPEFKICAVRLAAVDRAGSSGGLPGPG
jgi:assimilatory nitrate reductase catalytic subunit